jgi:hypothetical protein
VLTELAATLKAESLIISAIFFLLLVLYVEVLELFEILGIVFGRKKIFRFRPWQTTL